jgi:hypothetical protein
MKKVAGPHQNDRWHQPALYVEPAPDAVAPLLALSDQSDGSQALQHPTQEPGCQTPSRSKRHEPGLLALHGSPKRIATEEKQALPGKPIAQHGVLEELISEPPALEENDQGRIRIDQSDTARRKR